MEHTSRGRTVRQEEVEEYARLKKMKPNFTGSEGDTFVFYELYGFDWNNRLKVPSEPVISLNIFKK